MQPLEHVVIINAEKFGAGNCRVPFCYGWNRDKHGLCDFHIEWARRQIGEPWTTPEEMTGEEAREAYSAHVSRAMTHIPFHLMMASLWPGPYAAERRKNAMREKSLKQRWEEDNDR